AGRCPLEVGGDPDPPRAVVDPIARPPDVALAVNPAARHIDRVVGGGRRHRSVVDRGGRLRQILQLPPRRHALWLLPGPFIRRRPDAADPLPAIADLAPAARHPDAIGWRHAPEATDPNEVLPLLVVAPVAWHPLDILAFGLLVGRHLVDRLR